MVVEVVVPPAGESIQEGMLVEWAQPDGSLVRAEEPLFILETDKVTLTVNAPQSGRLAVKVPAGEMVKIGQGVATLDTSAAAEAEAARPASAPLPPAPPVIAAAPPPAPAPPAVPKSAAPSPPITPPAGVLQMRSKAEGKALDDLAPSVRRLVSENGLDPARIAATGKDGRLTKEDVLAHLQRPQTVTADGGRPTADAAAAAVTTDRTVRKPLSPIRQRIAERMLVSQQSTATLTTFNEADLSALLELRKKYREAFKAKHHVDLGFLPFFVKAVVEGLQAAPSLRSMLEGAELVRHDYFDIGIAVAAEHGLAVPVVRDADRKSLAEIQDDIETLARKVREKSITLGELQGAVFSITNAGSYGALMGTPILNPPQSGILGMYTIQERPVARDGQVVIRPMMYLALSYDHRVVDGKEAGTFLKSVAEGVETPARFLLGLD